MKKNYNFYIGVRKSKLTICSFFIGKEGCKTRTFFMCKCDCGGTRKISANDFIKGFNLSCGCDRDRLTRERNYIDGRKKDPVYYVYRAMIDRCNNSNHKAYKHYGGRGIKVCERWLSDFVNFKIDMGDRPKGLTIDRINNNGNYEPKNCRWADMKTQNNNKRNNIKNQSH